MNICIVKTEVHKTDFMYLYAFSKIILIHHCKILVIFTSLFNRDLFLKLEQFSFDVLMCVCKFMSSQIYMSDFKRNIQQKLF